MQSLEGRRVAEAEPESFRCVAKCDAQTEVRASELKPEQVGETEPPNLPLGKVQ